jgi:galactokinase
MTMIEKITAIFQQKFGTQPAFIAQAPGRVNLLGEHVDYNDGFVMPVAIDRATYIAFSPAAGLETCLVAADFDQQARFSSDSIATKTQTDGSQMPEWGLYPAGMCWALSDAGLATPAINAVFSSNVPRGSGLSSSASVEMAFAIAWQQVGGWSLTPMERARLGQRAENQYVGVSCGIMDQFASACGENNRLLFLDCRSLQYHSLPLPENIALVVADTGVRRKLTTGEYNRRHDACTEAVRLLQNHLPAIQALRDVSPEDFNRFSADLPEEVKKRARHIISEVRRTITAIPLLEKSDMAGFGKLMNECHISLRDDYEVSIDELDTMVSIAQGLPGCYGARLTGAGFGGCTINLVERTQAEQFAQLLRQGYQQATGQSPEIYICQASQGAGML